MSYRDHESRHTSTLRARKLPPDMYLLERAGMSDDKNRLERFVQSMLCVPSGAVIVEAESVELHWSYLDGRPDKQVPDGRWCAIFPGATTDVLPPKPAEPATLPQEAVSRLSEKPFQERSFDTVDELVCGALEHLETSLDVKVRDYVYGYVEGYANARGWTLIPSFYSGVITWDLKLRKATNGGR